MKKIDWYDEFVDTNYTPSKNHLIALFYFEPPHGMTKEESAGRIASESSTGTWTTLSKLPPRMKELQATAFEIDGNYLKVAYPRELWENGNFCQLLSGIAGNIFGMKGVNHLRLLDVCLPQSYIKHFKGPILGMEGIRKRWKIYKRPLTGAVPKPKIGFSAQEHAKVGYETWMGGFDFVKDDENLTSTKFNKFEERVKLTAKYRDKAENETGERKGTFINITAETEEMKRRADLLHEYGFDYAMLDVVIVGTAALMTMREYLGDLGITTHAHRAMHAAFDRNPKHGISMQFIAKQMRLIGLNQLHSGTAVGKLVGSKEEVQSIADILREKKTPGREHILLDQDWYHIKSAFPVSSGGLHPGLIPEVMEIYGLNVVLLISGGIHGHPDGTRAGAKASMQAIEATMEGITLEEKAKSCPELRVALEKWGHYQPK
ncbi:MAG: type III ribulose-bisphosphate carboxylase [Theionarchaea archaeon]|nr:MAG: ribulose 1,5-bisphosphate carboxylase [Theionarchaea archaeon DG-70-1]MBU7029758.1 type III ribulose-bisphosphate carboxylase [Theionarchaea archaeon]